MGGRGLILNAIVKLGLTQVFARHQPKGNLLLVFGLASPCFFGGYLRNS